MCSRAGAIVGRMWCVATLMGECNDGQAGAIAGWMVVHSNTGGQTGHDGHT